MKTLKQHIFEKLKVSKETYTLFPKTKDELKRIIADEILKNGNKCSLNHIDVSKITDMSSLFFNSSFNGDISQCVPDFVAKLIYEKYGLKDRSYYEQ